MFNIQDFIKNNLINGVANGSFTREYANILAVNYMAKGLIDIATVQEIDVSTTPVVTEILEQNSDNTETTEIQYEENAEMSDTQNIEETEVIQQG